MTRTITVSVEEDVERRFRKVAGMRYGRRKGYIGKAVSNAMRVWLSKMESEDVDLQAIKELRKGYKLGEIVYRERGELHER